MNIENINKTIDFLKTRKWHSDDFLMHDDCMVGIIGDALHGDRAHSRADNKPYGLHYIADAFDIGVSAARCLYIMNQSDAAVNPYASLATFMGMRTEKQNRVLIRMLEGLRASGGTRVFWDFNA
jgi:hypothetical protein